MWLGRLLHGLVFEWKRLRTVAAKMENGMADIKRNGWIMVKAVDR